MNPTLHAYEKYGLLKPMDYVSMLFDNYSEQVNTEAGILAELLPKTIKNKREVISQYRAFRSAQMYTTHPMFDITNIANNLNKGTVEHTYNYLYSIPTDDNQNTLYDDILAYKQKLKRS